MIKKFKYSVFVYLSILPLVVLQLLSCGLFHKNSKPATKRVKMTIVAHQNLNESEPGVGHSVQVRFFLLKNAREFENIFDYHAVATDPIGTIGDDFIEEIEPPAYLLPAEKMEKIINASPEAEYLGVIASYSKPYNDIAKAWASLKKNKELVLELQKDRIVLQDD